MSILPRHTYGVVPEYEPPAVLDVEGLPVHRQWQFVYPQGKHIAPAARAIMDFVRSGAASVVGPPGALS